MSEQQQEKLNDFFVGVFNQILAWEGQTIRNIVLFGVLIYELFGPMLTKIALTKLKESIENE